MSDTIVGYRPFDTHKDDAGGVGRRITYCWRGATVEIDGHHGVRVVELSVRHSKDHKRYYVALTPTTETRGMTYWSSDNPGIWLDGIPCARYSAKQLRALALEHVTWLMAGDYNHSETVVRLMGAWLAGE